MPKEFVAEIEWRDPNDLTPYPFNNKLHDTEQIDKVAGSIAEFGCDQPLVIDSDGVIIKGHARREAALRLGLDKVPVVVRNDLSEAQKKASRIADNRTAISDFDEQAIALELQALEELGYDLTQTGFDTEEIDELLKLNGGEGYGGGTGDEDDVPDVEEVQPREGLVLGSIWGLGRHSLMCGDSTDEEQVRRLLGDRKVGMVWADVPYGYEYSSNMRVKSKKFDVIQNDDKILIDFLHPVKLLTSGWVLICTSWKVISEWIAASKCLGDLQNIIIWDKGGGGMGDLSHSLSTDYEMILAYNRGETIKSKRIGSVWSIGKDNPNIYQHPTQKPVELVFQALESFSEVEAVVFDPFVGSGTSFLAAQKSRRTVFGCEIDPGYCEVILQRFQAFTGIEPVSLEQS